MPPSTQLGIDDENGVDRGRYAPAARDAVYRVLAEQAERLLARGVSVVLDATWAAERHRRLARAVGERTVAAIDELECRAPLEVAMARIDQRAGVGNVLSEATPAVARAVAERFEPWSSAISIDTTGPPDEIIDVATGHVLTSGQQSDGRETATDPS